MTGSEPPTLKMSAAERRRQKIIARGKSRLEGITNLTLNDVKKPLEDQSDISFSTTSVQKRSTDSVEEAAANGAVASKMERKLGTAAGDEWIKYEVEEETQICTGTRQPDCQERISERIASAVNKSKVVRAMFILFLTFFLGIFRYSVSMKLPRAKDIELQRHEMISTCTDLLPINFGWILFDYFSPCLEDVHKYLALELRFRSGESREITWLGNSSLHRPFLLVAAASPTVVIVFSLVGLFFRHDVADRVSERDLTMIDRLKKMLPASVSKILDTVDLAKLALSTIFLDAELFALTSIMYYLLPLAL